MKCKVFMGASGEVEVAFNNWAKGKALNKDIIIHTNMHYVYVRGLVSMLSIVVIYPEGSAWDKEPEQPKVAYTKEDIAEKAEQQLRDNP